MPSTLADSPPAPVISTPAEIHDTRQPVNTASPNLWERIAIACRAKGYSLSTERSYVQWARRYALWAGRVHPAKLGPAEMQGFLNYLAVEREVAPSTAKQALCALLFLYQVVLGREVPRLELQAPRGQTRLPVVLSQASASRLVSNVRVMALCPLRRTCARHLPPMDMIDATAVALL